MALASPPTGVSNGDLIRWTFEILNRREVVPVRQLWTDATVERFPDRTCRGPDEIAAYFTELFAALPDWHMEILALVEHGDDVFVQWRLTGTHSGPVLGIAPTGKAVTVDGMDHFVVRDGKVVSNFVVFDQMQYARQIGLLPPDGSAADRALKGAFNARTRVADRLRRHDKR